MTQTETVIREQFPFWQAVLDAPEITKLAGPHAVLVGCGTSYNLALSLAAAFNAAGHSAQAVPAHEWLRRRRDYAASGVDLQIVVLSRSGETTEAVDAARAARKAGDPVTAVTCFPNSELASLGERVIIAETHPDEEIVMTASASLMLIAGLRLAGVQIDPGSAEEAQSLLDRLEAKLSQVAERQHIVYLGGGPLYGIAVEGSLKLQEMSQVFTQAYHPLEYRHGPISMIDANSAVAFLYSDETEAEEAKLAAELSQKGAFVVGLGGPGDLSLPVKTTGASRALVVLPALQLLGERLAQARGIDTVSPRHLTKVVQIG